MHYTKRIAQALAAAGLVLVMTVGTAFASYGTGIVTADSLRMRSKPSTNSDVLTNAPEGSEVELLSGEENGWYKVSYKGKEGYMSAEWVKVVSTANASAQKTSGVVNAGPLNVRSGPGTKYDRVGSLKEGAVITILETSGDWYKITCGSISGYVSGEYVTLNAVSSEAPQKQEPEQEPEKEPETPPEIKVEEMEAQSGLVMTSSLNIRSGPSTDYDRVGSLKVGNVITIIGKSGNWYKITAGKVTGYVSAKYVTPMNELESSPVGEAAAALAKSLIGAPYVYGAEGPKSFDCSGLIYYIFEQLGYKLGRTATQQYQNNGEFVAFEDLEPGDLIFIYNPKYDKSGGTKPVTHVGIYVGNDQFIHASTSGDCVKYSDLYGNHYKYMVGFKRIG